MSKNNPRLFVYPADVARVTGRRPRTARHILQKIRMLYGKDPGELVTVKEFCDYFGVEEDYFRKHMDGDWV